MSKIKTDATNTKGASICNRVLHGDTDSHDKATRIIGTVKTVVMNRAVKFLFAKLRENSRILKPTNKKESARIGNDCILSSNEQAETVVGANTKTESTMYLFSKIITPVLIDLLDFTAFASQTHNDRLIGLVVYLIALNHTIKLNKTTEQREARLLARPI